jgi:hypothetical protein
VKGEWRDGRVRQRNLSAGINRCYCYAVCTSCISNRFPKKCKCVWGKLARGDHESKYESSPCDLTRAGKGFGTQNRDSVAELFLSSDVRPFNL